MGAEMSGHLSLKKTTDSMAERWSGSYTYIVETDVEYAVFMEFGTRPHTITPNTARALHFWVDGVEVFTDIVHHPGTEPRPYMRPGAEGAARQIRPIAATATSLADVIEQLAERVKEIARRLAPRDTGRLAMSITVRRVG